MIEKKKKKKKKKKNGISKFMAGRPGERQELC